jgi:hypothetical protein
VGKILDYRIDCLPTNLCSVVGITFCFESRFDTEPPFNRTNISETTSFLQDKIGVVLKDYIFISFG